MPKRGEKTKSRAVDLEEWTDNKNVVYGNNK